MCKKKTQTFIKSPINDLFLYSYGHSTEMKRKCSCIPYTSDL